MAWFPIQAANVFLQYKNLMFYSQPFYHYYVFTHSDAKGVRPQWKRAAWGLEPHFCKETLQHQVCNPLHLSHAFQTRCIYPNMTFAIDVACMMGRKPKKQSWIVTGLQAISDYKCVSAELRQDLETYCGLYQHCWPWEVKSYAPDGWCRYGNARQPCMSCMVANPVKFPPFLFHQTTAVQLQFPDASARRLYQNKKMGMMFNQRKVRNRQCGVLS